MKVHDLGSTVQYHDPTWNERGFAEEGPQRLWAAMPERLRAIALDEIRLGNSVKSILENKQRGIVLLSFGARPAVERSTGETLVVHLEHRYGNYCYEGTWCTYEDRVTGCFLAFPDSDLDPA